MNNIVTITDENFGVPISAQEPAPKDFAYSRLLSYIRMQMPNYIIGRHHLLIAHYLQQLEKGEITRLAIFMPPRHGKTMLASEFFSAWYLGRNPTHEIIFASYAQDRSDDVGKAVRDLMLSNTHEQVFPEGKLRIDAKGTRKFQTIEDGTFFSTSWKGATTGRGANCFPAGTIIDTEIGKMPIEQLSTMENPPLVLSLDHLGQLCYSKIECSRIILKRSIYEFKTNSGKTLRGTADHRIYSRTRGFTKLRNLNFGEEILHLSSNVATGQTFNFEMYQMWRFFHSFECRCPEIYKTWLCGRLLFAKLFQTRSRHEKQSSLHSMQGTSSEIKKWETNWQRLLSKMFHIFTLIQTTSEKTMQRMWNLVLAERNTNSILQQKLFKFSTLSEDDWKEQFSLQEWFELCEMVFGYEANNSRTRSLQMCGLRCDRGKEKNKSFSSTEKIEFGYSPYRSKPTEQRNREFGDSVQSLSYNTSQIECDTISMAPRLCDSQDTVYDLQIEGTRNFFAEEILVHNCLILDDLIKDREDAQSETNRRKREEWFSSSGYTRLMADEGSPEGRILLIMTRWSYDDIAAYLLEQLAHEKWHILNCPAIAEENDILGRMEGDALWPERYPVSRLEKVKKSVISTDWTSLYQQRPLPKEGGMWKLYWFKEYNTHHLRLIEDKLKDNQDLPEELKWFSRIVMSIDTAYKPEQINDPSVITVWGYSKNRQYLIEVLKEKFEYPELKKWIIRCHKRYVEWNMGPVPILIEDAASGQSLIQDFKVSDYRMPVIPITPVKSKLVRAEQASGYVESGNIILPERAPWKTDYETEFAQFPFGAHDDQVDSTSQYINWFYKPRKRKRRGKMHAK